MSPRLVRHLRDAVPVIVVFVIVALTWDNVRWYLAPEDGPWEPLVVMFLGVLLAYGIVGPLAGRLKQVLEQDEQIFHAVKQVIIASLYGHPQPLVVESARSGLGHTVRPGLTELLDALRGR